jgi:preprotein translocase subunit YajC
MLGLEMMAFFAPAAGGGGGLMQMMMPMAFIIGIMYFMMIRPQQRKEKERRLMIENLKSGAKVIFGGGLVGTITNVKDTTFVIKMADNVKIEALRGSVSKVLEKGDKVEDEEKK